MEDEIYDVLDAINVQRENDKWTKTSPFPLGGREFIVR